MEHYGYKILVVDNESESLEKNVKILRGAGFDTHTAISGIEAISVSVKLQPHLILLEMELPTFDGIETCEEIKKNELTQNCLVAFYTKSNEDYSQIAAFEAGADGYIVKPVNHKVLLCQIKALLRLSPQIVEFGQQLPPAVRPHGIFIDREQYLVFANGKKMVLPRKEFELLWLLYGKPHKVFTRDEIYQAVWGDETIVGDRTIDVHIRKLREKIGDNHIHTVKGVGYRFIS